MFVTPKFEILRLCVALSFFVISSVASATIYYVDTNHASANDANNGSEAQPWKTIQKAANVLVAGDTVYVKQGVYTELSTAGPESDKIGLKPQNSGTTGNYITYEAYPGHLVVLDQKNSGNGFFISGKHYIKIKGFEIRNIYGKGGVWTKENTSGFSSNIVVDSCYIHDLDGKAGDNVAGLRFDLVVKPVARNNLIHTVRVGGTNDKNSAGILSYKMEDALIENNEMYDTHNGVFHKKSTGKIGALIRNNLIYNVTRGVFYDLSGGGNPPHINQRVTKNIFYNVETGIWLHAPDAGGVHDGFHVWNNVIVASKVGVDARNAKDINIYNNMFVGPNSRDAIRFGDDVAISAISELNYNGYFNTSLLTTNLYGSSQKGYNTLSALQSALGFELNGYEGPPVFVSEANRDYHLLASSPLKGAGKSGVDIGAYPLGNEIIGLTRIRPKPPVSILVK